MTDTQPQAAEQITATLAAWPGVQTAAHRFGGIAFRLGRRELGHLHGNRLADLPFTRPVRDALIAEGRAHPHHVLPNSGWVSLPIRTPDDVDAAIDLFKLSDDHAQRTVAKRHHWPADQRPT
ncbi:MAG: luciferase family protein [Solirubrobacteraceae bacterium]